jgi:hypothetical protein
MEGRGGCQLLNANRNLGILQIEQKIGLKSKLALQFVSNCETNSKREKFLDELKKHMNVTEIGQCAKNRGCQGECYDKMIGKSVKIIRNQSF